MKVNILNILQLHIILFNDKNYKLQMKFLYLIKQSEKKLNLALFNTSTIFIKKKKQLGLKPQVYTKAQMLYIIYIYIYI